MEGKGRVKEETPFSLPLHSLFFHEIVYKSMIICIIIILFLSFIFDPCGSSELLLVCERNY